MVNINVLDCTLRDGGYVNDWAFNNEIILNIIKALDESSIDIIECGYLNTKKGKVENTTLFNDIKTLNSLLLKNGFADKSKNFVLMINYGDYDLETLPDRNHKDNLIKGIRFAFHKENSEVALQKAKTIIDKGYDLYLQPMVTIRYTDLDILKLIEAANSLDIKAFYIVDSFGSMSKSEFKRYLYLVHNNLKSGVILGFHSHNNMQLAFANAVELITNISNREISIDSSIFGMGRGAGNLNTELLADYLNKNNGKNYKIVPLLDVIDKYLEALYRESYWGFSVAHFLSAKTSIHPNYASFLVNKKNLSIVSIENILNSLDGSKANTFDNNYIQDIYFNYNSRNKRESNIDKKLFKGKNILILAPGSSVIQHENSIKQFIKTNRSILIAVNHCPQKFEHDYLFFSNQKRYDEFINKIENASKLIVSSNIDVHDKHKNCFVVDYEKYVSMNLNHSDNVTLLIINLLLEQGVGKISIAGLDGYDLTPSNNYSYEEYGRVLDKKQIKLLNQAMIQNIQEISKKTKLHFLTPSLYDKCLCLNVLGIIPARYKSSRFEGKPLQLIDGIPMLKRTYLQAKKCNNLSDLVVATDDDRIYDFCKTENIPVIMTSGSCLTGTDRIAEVAKSMDYDLYVNIQGDEPVISPESIDEVIEAYKKYGNEYIAYNLFKQIDDEAEIEANTSIKVIINEKNELVYMSRYPVPYNKGKESCKFYKQVCVYGFTKQALEVFGGRDKTRNEIHEDIELLRFIDLGYKVKMIETTYNSISVDIPEDIKKVEAFLSEKG